MPPKLRSAASDMKIASDPAISLEIYIVNGRLASRILWAIVAAMFEGFARRKLGIAAGEVSLAIGGKGPPLLLLHGYPQTHAMWHKIAPALSKAFTVVCPDLRGYGDSMKPPSDADHAGYAKRAMAQDQVDTMQALGFERFAVAGPDRGGRVAHRLALDHGDRVERIAVLEICPTHSM